MAGKHSTRRVVRAPTQIELGWTAGFLEGEGTFTINCGSAQVKASQVQRQPLELLQECFGGSICGRTPKIRNAQFIHQWTLCGPRAAGLMMTLYALMSPRRREQIRHALAQWRARPVSHRYKPTCAQGHVLSGENVYWNGRRRVCRVCKILRERHKRRRKREEQIYGRRSLFAGIADSRPIDYSVKVPRPLAKSVG